MCLALLYYYPRIENFKACLSMPTIPEFNRLYEALSNDKLMDPVQLTSLLDYYKPSQALKNSIKTISASPRTIEVFKNFYEGNFRKHAFCGVPEQNMMNSLKLNLSHYEPSKNSIKEDICQPDEYGNTPCKVVMTTTEKPNTASSIIPSVVLIGILLFAF